MEVIPSDIQSRLQLVISKAAVLLPSDIGQQLLAMVTPSALATMAGVIVVWAGAHFFGIGEIADLVLLIVGWVAVGGVALEAAKKLFDFATKTNAARSEGDLDVAAKDLADAITLLGVNAVLALLLKKKPGDTFKTPFRGVKMPRYSSDIGRKMNLPRNGGWRYTPKIKITKHSDVVQDAQNPGGT